MLPARNQKREGTATVRNVTHSELLAGFVGLLVSGAVVVLTHSFVASAAIGFAAAMTLGALHDIEQKLGEIRDELRKATNK